MSDQKRSAVAQKYTPIKKITPIVDEVRKHFKNGGTFPLEWRISQIQAIVKLIQENKPRFEEALRHDLGATDFWIQRVELDGVLGEAREALKNLKSWVKDEVVTTTAVTSPGKSYIQRQAYGVVLIISPWNYPASLVFSPMIAAIAAGNAIVYKPSEVSDRTGALIAELGSKYLCPKHIAVICGAVEETATLLANKFDFICYTGSTMVGKIVMKAAAETLTPVLLELGGKCPAIISSDANLDRAVERICWGKWSLNNGQSCLSPDYILTTPEMKPKIVEKFKAVLTRFFGADHTTSPGLSRVVTVKHTERLVCLLEEGTELVGDPSTINIADRFIPPLVVSATPESPLMKDEIFGPILPLLTMQESEFVSFVNSKPKPLALYVFSENSKNANEILRQTSSGSACINDCVIHYSNHHLPFGGVGDSGIGNYHGKHGFLTFSHPRSVYVKYGQDAPIRFPPYSAKQLSMLGFAATVDINAVKKYAVAAFVILAAIVAFFMFPRSS